MVVVWVSCDACKGAGEFTVNDARGNPVRIRCNVCDGARGKNVIV